MRAREEKKVEPAKSRPLSEMYRQAMAELVRPMPSVKLPSWKTFNQVTGGFRAREYSILCGPTGLGKTTLLANFSAELLDARVPHFVMSVETGGVDYVKRVLSAKAGHDLNLGDPIDQGVAEEVHDMFGEQFAQDLIHLSLYENRVSSEQLKHDVIYHLERFKCGIAFLDNLNFFMEPTSAGEWNMEMDRVTHDLIIFCKQYPVHLVMVMHPRKTDGGRVAHEFDVKGSSTAVQEAQNIFFLNRPTPEDIQSGARHPTDRELLVGKMRRRGRYVGSKIFFQCHGSTYREITQD